MKNKLVLNTFTSILLQVVTFVCGLILPRMILGNYGSEVNGLVQSVTQFLGVLTLTELGIGQVIQSALYRPLACKDWSAVSGIATSGTRFFKKLAVLLVAYVSILIILYPLVIKENFDFYFTAGLIFAMSINTFAQYYFGMVDKILLNADQRGYIQYFSQIVSLIMNVIICVFLIHADASIQVVKLASSLVFFARPVLVRIYVSKTYSIDRNVALTQEPIRQKWNGVAQHVAAFVLDGTDNIVLTVFSSLSNVSIYSSYYMVVHGIRQLYQSCVAGIQSAIGHIWAKGDKEKLLHTFRITEMSLHFLTVFLFSCTGRLIIPFMRVYTDGIVDIDYIHPVFAFLLVAANAVACLKTPYNIVILAAGHYKQTQRCHIIAAAMNLVISVVAVKTMGLIGVAIGTLAAMVYQTVWMAGYVSGKIIDRSMLPFVGQLLLDALTVAVIMLLTWRIKLVSISFFSWILMAVKVALVAILVIAGMLLLFRRKLIMELFRSRKAK